MLQPHLDDLPFSIGHLIQNEALKPLHYEMWTVFGKEFFNIRNYPHNRETEAILEEEERLWFQLTGHPGNRLELQEAGYRGVTGVRRLFLTSLYKTADLDYEALGYGNWAEVVESIHSLIHSDVVYIWAPAGVGGHCDHLAVRQAVIHLAQLTNVQGILFYHELPYSQYSRPIDWNIFSIEGFQHSGLIAYTPSEREIEEKQSRISVFHSQINERQSMTLARETERVSVWLRRSDHDHPVS